MKRVVEVSGFIITLESTDGKTNKNVTIEFSAVSDNFDKKRLENLIKILKEFDDRLLYV